MQSFPYHLYAEGRALRSRVGGVQTLLVHVALIGVFGVALPWNKGLEFLDPVIITAYACLSIIFAAPAAAQAFTGELPQTMAEVMARILIAILYGECVAAAMLLTGFATVYLTHLHRTIFRPDIEGLISAGALGITGSLALAAAAAWISLRFSAKVARVALRLIFILILVGFFYRSQSLPDLAAMAAIECLIAAVAILFAVWLAIRKADAARG